MELALFDGEPVRKETFPAWPQYGNEDERQSLLEVLASGTWGGYSAKIQEFEAAFSHLHRVRHAISCSNGTVALEVALHALGIGCGDEVIVPAITFVATATAALLCHAVPVFVDIEAKTLNISPPEVEAAITSRTRAIIAVHFGGHPADMDALTAIAQRHGVALIEDAAHAHGASWRGTPVGNFGEIATFSFQAFKLMTSGEGGILLTNSASLAERIRGYCNQGRRQGGGWFEHFTLGTNYRITGFQAAILSSQLGRLSAQSELRGQNVRYLRNQLRGFRGLTLADDDSRATQHPHYLLTLRYDKEAFGGLDRNMFIRAVQAEGIPAQPTYPYPLYRNPVFHTSALPPCKCANWKSDQVYESLFLRESEQVCKDGIWLEHHLFLGDKKDVDDMVAAFEKVQRLAASLVVLKQQNSDNFQKVK